MAIRSRRRGAREPALRFPSLALVDGVRPTVRARLARAYEAIVQRFVAWASGEATIRAADYVIDLGPGAGEHGGAVEPVELLVLLHLFFETTAQIIARRMLLSIEPRAPAR